MLRELGYDEAHIAALKQAGAVTGSAGTTTASSLGPKRQPSASSHPPVRARQNAVGLQGRSGRKRLPVSECPCAQRAQPSSPLGTCHLQIASLYDHRSAFLDLSSLVFRARGLLKRAPVLVKPSKVSVVLRSMLDIIKRCMRDQDGNERWTVEHAEPYAPYAFPGWVAK